MASFRSLLLKYSKTLTLRQPKVIKSVAAGSNTIFRNYSSFTYVADIPKPENGTTTRMNLCQALTSAMDLALESDPTTVIFGEDVAFGGVFRCQVYNNYRQRGHFYS